MAATRLPMKLDPRDRSSVAPFLRTSAPVRLASGFHAPELEGVEAFQWMMTHGRIEFAPERVARFLELWVCCEFADLSQALTVGCGDHQAGVESTITLPYSWGPLSIDVPSGADHIEFAANRLFPRSHHPGDARELSLRVREARLHADPRRHEAIERQRSNAVLNLRELLDGKHALESTPPSLGIDLHGSCNVKPPCVYCEWDTSKEQEGDNVDTPFTLETLDQYGALFDNSTKLVNCSIGEPFMMKQIDDLLDRFGDEGKTLEMSTNGQIFTDQNIQKLLGRNVMMYISLDAATAETYARLRNDTFDAILTNLRRLIAAKGGKNGWPQVFLVFMPMKANVHELDPFVRLCADLGVDKLVLRPLNDSEGNDLDWDREGYRFNYPDQLLPFQRLVEASGRAAELCERYGVELSDQMDFGGALEDRFEDAYETGRAAVRSGVELAAPATPPETVVAEAAGPEWVASVAAVPQPVAPEPVAPEPAAAPNSDSSDAELPTLGLERWPVCAEPWRSLYILRRGLRPCCYGGGSLGGMDDHQEGWNSAEMQDIRRELAAGRFHDYCVKSPACPIVRKAEHAQELSTKNRMFQLVWRSWQTVNQVTGSVPRRLLHRLRGDRA